LVLHSYHLLYPTKHLGTRKEIYEREIGLELEKLQLPNVVVKESPKNRYVNGLLNKYKSRFVLDLHDNTLNQRKYEPSTTVGDIFHSHTYHHLEYFQKYKKKFENDTKGEKTLNYVGRKRIGDFTPPTLIGDMNPRLFGIELFPWVSKKNSLYFLKHLTSYLQSHPIYTK